MIKMRNFYSLFLFDWWGFFAYGTWIHSCRRGKRTGNYKAKDEPSRRSMAKVKQRFCRTEHAPWEFENMGPNTRMFSLTERDVYGALSAYKQPMMKEKEMNQMVLKWGDTSPRRAACMSFRRHSRRRHCYHRRWQLCSCYCPRRPASGTRCQVIPTLCRLRLMCVFVS